MNTAAPRQLIETPASVPGGAQYQHLAYVDAYDAVINCDYAFVAYKETDSNGDWRVRIKSSQTDRCMHQRSLPLFVAVKTTASSTLRSGLHSSAIQNNSARIGAAFADRPHTKLANHGSFARGILLAPCIAVR